MDHDWASGAASAGSKIQESGNDQQNSNVFEYFWLAGHLIIATSVEVVLLARAEVAAHRHIDYAGPNVLNLKMAKIKDSET